jgi:hypothetical protein
MLIPSQLTERFAHRFTFNFSKYSVVDCYMSDLAYWFIELLEVCVSNLGQDNICSDCIFLVPLSRILGRDLVLNWSCPLHASSSPLSFPSHGFQRSVAVYVGPVCQGTRFRPISTLNMLHSIDFLTGTSLNCETVC